MNDENYLQQKPTTIPKEYGISSNHDVLLNVFTNQHDKDLGNDLVNCLQKINVDSQLKSLTTNIQLLEDLKSIQNEAKDKNALVLFFIGLYAYKKDRLILQLDKRDSIEVRKIWQQFREDIFEEFKNKPKIFIFSCALLHDKFDEPKSKYVVPTESDILLVYHKSDLDDKKLLLKQFSFNLEKYSAECDIIDLLTCSGSENFRKQPTVISTLSKKFYFTNSNQRGHFLSVNDDNVAKTLQQIDIKIDAMNSNLRKVIDAPKVQQNIEETDASKLPKIYFEDTKKKIVAENSAVRLIKNESDHIRRRAMSDSDLRMLTIKVRNSLFEKHGRFRF